MPCTTILVGRKATYDGSTLVARNDDSGAGRNMPKKFIVVMPKDQPSLYRSVLSGVEIPLPKHAMRYTAVPNAVSGRGIWAAGGVNERNVAMTATETITSNARVLGADPLLHPLSDESTQEHGGIGEEDIVTLTLPYIRSAREGVERLGALLKRYGTYEMNGIAFQDAHEIWWMETVGGHHWIARKVPDDEYVVMPNQLGIDFFDLVDALGTKRDFLCSEDLREWIAENHLDLTIKGKFNARYAFGSHDDADHLYNTPRAWYIEKTLNPNTYRWDGPDADYGPESDDIPWGLVPERKITVEDIKYLLSSHFQGTPYDPYATRGDLSKKGLYRPIGVNRTDFLGCYQIRPNRTKYASAIEWIAFGSNVFNTMVPFYADISSTPEYLSCTDGAVSTESFYWCSRLIGAMADANWPECCNLIERYQFTVQANANAILRRYDNIAATGKKETLYREKANQEISDMVEKLTGETLSEILKVRTNHMKNSFARSDA